MDNELEDKIDKLTKVVEEDHKLIKGMHSRMRLTNAFRIIYWIVIILLALGAYVYVQPYVDSFKDAYNSVNEFRTSVTGENSLFKAFFGGGATSTQ